jgi:hypothetical protein
MQKKIKLATITKKLNEMQKKFLFFIEKKKISIKFIK